LSLCWAFGCCRKAAKVAKTLRATHWVHAYVLVCLRALCGEYMSGLLLILYQKSWGSWDVDQWYWEPCWSWKKSCKFRRWIHGMSWSWRSCKI
jgi:hypothetical protein